MGDEDDPASDGDSGGGGVGASVEQDRPHVQVPVFVVPVMPTSFVSDIAAEEERSAQQDHRGDAADDEHGKAVDLAGTGDEAVDGSGGNEHAQDEQPPELTRAAKRVALG